MMKILLLEDDVELCNAIERELVKHDYIVDSCNDGESAMLYALHVEYAYDIAIVDRMLPIIDGLTIIKAMRKKGLRIPILITTGMSSIEDRIEGLDGGADDYLIKPFHMQELLARVRALTRRPATLQKEILTYLDLSFNKCNRTITCGDRSLLLTAKETNLLDVFMQHPEELFTREQLMVKTWGSASDVELGNVDNYISFLRKRLKELHSQCVIKTVYGAGYTLESSNA